MNSNEEDLPTEPDPEDYVMSPCGQLGARTSVSQVEGAHLGEFSTEDEARAAIAAKSDAEKWWPAVWIQDDHGGFTLVE